MPKSRKNTSKVMTVKLAGHNKPPRLAFTIQGRHTFRFQMSQTSNTRTNFSRMQILSLYMTAASTTVGYPIFGAVRINKVSIWGPTPTSGTANTTNRIDLIWAGVTGAQIEWSDQSTSSTEVPYISEKPPKFSSADAWSNFPFAAASPTGTAAGEGAELLFSVFASPNSILDLDVSYTCNDTPSFFTYTTTGLTQGANFYNPLDNLGISGAARNWDPQGVRDFTN